MCPVSGCDTAQVLTGFESNLFWQAASDFNASKLLRGKILSVYLASYLEIWRLWGQLKHELIPNIYIWLNNTRSGSADPGCWYYLCSWPQLSDVRVNLYVYRSLVRSCPVSAVCSQQITNQLPWSGSFSDYNEHQWIGFGYQYPFVTFGNISTIT